MTKHTYSLTPAESRRINAEAVVQLGEETLRLGIVKRGIPGTLEHERYMQVLHYVAAAKRTVQSVPFGG